MSEDRKVVQKFKEQVSRAVRNYEELLLAVYNKRNQHALESLLSEQLVMSIAVVWEGFLSDLLITYMTLDPRKGLDSLKDSINQSIKDRFGVEAIKIIRFSNPKSMSKARVAALIDPKGWNWSFQTADSIAIKANKVLAGQYAKKFTLEPDDSKFLDFLVSIRNYLGHRSSAARSALKVAISQLNSGANSTLKAPFKKVGSYLKQKDANGKTRAVLIARRLIEIADKL